MRKPKVVVVSIPIPKNFLREEFLSGVKEKVDCPGFTVIDDFRQERSIDHDKTRDKIWKDLSIPSPMPMSSFGRSMGLQFKSMTKQEIKESYFFREDDNEPK